MTDAIIVNVGSLLTQRALNGGNELDLLAVFCEACRQNGILLGRAVAFMGTLHPIYEERAFRWDWKEPVESISEYEADQLLSADSWRRSALFHLAQTGDTEVRRRIGFGNRLDFSGLEALAASGHTDFIAFACRFGKDVVVGDMNCFYSYFTTVAPNGFSEAELADLRTLVPQLALASRAAALTGITRTVASVYLGEDAAREVLSGEIVRGHASRINAVVWYSDLEGFTRLSDISDPDEIIPLLNDYSDAVISSVHEADGNVLKLIGDGTLAIFRAGTVGDACRSALQAYYRLRRKIPVLNARRQIEGRPVTDVYLGLHLGEVFYGNIGSRDRLDFTVVGRTVNEAARIAGLCHEHSANMIMSSKFVTALGKHPEVKFISIGNHGLRGVTKPMELFMLASDAKQC